jgi:hypothetical protein
MKPAHDVYAETNPAFCTFVLAEFVKAYLSINPAGPEVAIVYPALPIALSGDLGSAFEGTNKNTGLLEWLERSPQVQIALADRVNASLNIVTEAMRLSCFAGALSLTMDARVLLGDTDLSKRAVGVLDNAARQAIKRGERLGYWFAMAGSTRNVFDILGLTV